MITAPLLTLALSLVFPGSTPDTTRLTFVHGDERIVSWLDQGAVHRTDEGARVRLLRIRHPEQAFWVVLDIDCQTNRWALVGNKTVTASDDTPPSLEGAARYQAITRDDRSGRAVRDAMCDGRFVQASIAPVRGAAVAIARLAQTRAAAVRARPLELIVVHAGGSPVFLDRATLEDGGPQWQVRSLSMTAGRGQWSGWVVDCSRADLALDLQWTAPMNGTGYGTVTQDRFFGGQPASDPADLALVRTACDPGVWGQPVHRTIRAAVAAARANPR